MKQRSGSSSLSALKLKSFSSLVKWCAAHYTRHMKGHVSLRDLYGLCVNARTDSGKSLAVWMQQIWRSGNKCRNTLPVYFPESLCERGYREAQNHFPEHFHSPFLAGGMIFQPLSGMLIPWQFSSDSWKLTSLSLSDLILKKIYIFLFSLIFPCLACTYLDNAWNLVLWALPVSIFRGIV